jgi:hypothetical protein
MSLEIRVEVAEIRTRESLAIEILSSAKEITHIHGKHVDSVHHKTAAIQPLVIYGNDVYPEGLFQTDEVTLDKDEIKGTFRISTTFKKKSLSALNAHISSASLEELTNGQVKSSVTVNQNPREYQYINAEEKTLPSLEELKQAKKIMELLRYKYAHPNS